MSILRSGLVALAAAATITLAGPIASASAAGTNLVNDPDFSTPVAPAGSISTFCAPASCALPSTFGPWTVTSGSVDLYSNSFAAAGTGLPAGDPATTQVLDIDGNTPGTITAPLTAGPAAGTPYTGTVEVEGNENFCGPAIESMTISLGGAPTDQGAITVANSQTAWASISFSGTVGTTNSVLQIASNDPATSDCGIVFTDLSITAAAGTPLASPLVAGPAAGVIVLGGAAVWYLRRRRNTAPVAA
jgi:hypothetical protein